MGHFLNSQSVTQISEQLVKCCSHDLKQLCGHLTLIQY